MLFLELATRWKQLEAEASRNEMMRLLAELFAAVSSEEIRAVCYLSLGRLAPLFNRIEFSLAEKMVMRSIARTQGVETSEILKLYKGAGDLGTVVEVIKRQKPNVKSTHQKSKSSTVEVYEQLLTIAEDHGQGSQERKVEKLAALLSRLDPLSGKYVVRIVLGKLRLGFSDKTILDAISMMSEGDKSARVELDSAYQLYPDVGELAFLVKEYGIGSLNDRVTVTLGVPVLPALAQRLKTAEEMIAKMGTVMVEPKYDGTRVQIHFAKQNESNIKYQISNIKKNGDYLKTFTRNLDETTHMFPELSEMGNQVQADSVIIDSEAIGYDPKTGKLLPFQMTITRKRKHDVAQAQAEVPLKFFVYDLLYCDGKSLVHEPLFKRRKMLDKVIAGEGILELAPFIVTNNASQLKKYHKRQLDLGFEGALVKLYNSPYRSGRRGWSWVKFKEVAEQTGKLADTLDLVVMGFYRGRGKRSGFGIGAFLVGIPGEKDGEWLTVAKIGTGLSDAQWRELKANLERWVSVGKPAGYSVDKGLLPDVWVEPKIVVEIAADEITQSPAHTAGLALRFPRLVRFRTDKRADQATTKQELKDIQMVS
jgi:DNA ligase 1